MFVSNDQRRTHTWASGQIYWPAPKNLAGYGPSKSAARQKDIDWTSLLVAKGSRRIPWPHLSRTPAPPYLLLPSFLSSAASGSEKPAQDRRRILYREGYCQCRVHRGDRPRIELQTSKISVLGGLCGCRRGCHSNCGPQGPIRSFWVRLDSPSVWQTVLRVAAVEYGAGFARAGDGAGSDGHHTRFFISTVRTAKLSQGAQGGAEMTLAHRMELDPTVKQREYFARAGGTARLVWNGALARWNAEYEAGAKPK